MPAVADTRAPQHRSPRRSTRSVLLAALGVGLAGLALPGSPATTTAAAEAPAALVGLSAAVAVAPEPNPIAFRPPARPATALRRHPATASRSRALTGRWVRPVAAGIVSPYGPRWGGWHPGIDFGARYGTPIHVVGDGVVIGAGYLAGESGYGQIVLVRHAGGVITAYAHMSKVLAHRGQHVLAGDVLGLVGATGHVTGPHLHFEVRIGGRKVNPVPWLRAHGIRV